MNRDFEEKLKAYAEAAVRAGVNIQSGQRLVVEAPVETASFVRLIAENAYKAGARLVDVMWQDDGLKRIRFEHAPRDSFEEYPDWRVDGLLTSLKRGDGYLFIHAADPDLLSDQDQELVTIAQRTEDEKTYPCLEYLLRSAVNWGGVSVPIPSWAKTVFPDLGEDEQVSKLWETILQVCRINEDDPVAAWEEHVRALHGHREYLTGKKYAALKFTGPGTDLTVGLPEGHRWQGGRAKSEAGVEFIPNMPTEEVFTMPHKERVSGVVASTKPLSYAGELIEDFSLMFEKGRVVKAEARRGEDRLKDLVGTDEGAAALGEVALVPASSPVSKAGVLFYNALFDENAACHLALGAAIRICMEDGEEMSAEVFAAAGGNDSMVHVDFMVGSDRIDVDGVTVDGAAEPIMRSGEWAY